jgi:hypothetical protein
LFGEVGIWNFRILFVQKHHKEFSAAVSLAVQKFYYFT